ncbi:TPA: DUF551 domain-containing protein [Pasteurella multocida]|nr:DUF551 domain-containing protein [Pasteurella multocida]
MTETENKYFAVNIYDENSISFHKTEEEAKKACLNGAEELYDHATYNDDISLYTEQEHNAVYGVVLGKAESKTRELSEEEKQSSWYSEYDYLIEHPKIVEYPKCDGWISVKDRLPEPDDANAVMFWKGASHLVYGKPISGKGCGEKDIYFGFYLKNPSNNEDIWAWGWHKNSDGKIVFDEIEATHWRPLPQPPKTE